MSTASPSQPAAPGKPVPPGASEAIFAPRRQGIDLGDQVVVLVPDDPRSAGAGATIAADLRRAGCRRVVLARASDPAIASDRSLEAAPVIALGRFTDNPLVRRLYLTGRDLTDRVWPGPGGWALRSVARATDAGADAILLSLSDPADADAAAAAFGRVLDAHGTRLPWLLQVRLGRWEALYRRRLQELLPTPESSLDVIGGGSGDWDYMMAIGRAGVLAVKTQDPALVRRFVCELLRFLRVRFFERELADPLQIHGFLRHLLRPFAMLEHHPAVDDALRLEALQGLLSLYRSGEGAAHPGLLGNADHWRVRQNHGTRAALDVADGALYFLHHHGLQEARSWMDLAARFFAPQLTSSKPVCDSWGHQWVASLYNTAEYALLSGQLDYFDTPAFRAAADRALIAHSHLGPFPRLYLLMAAALTGDADYLALAHGPQPAPPEGRSEPRATASRTPERLVDQALAEVGGDEVGRTWITGVPARFPDRLTGVCVAPLAQLFHDSIESYPAFAPPGVYRCDVPFEATFDKISYRSGWGAHDTYLLLDGISGGSHSYQDANCIVRFVSGGHAWLGGPLYGTWSTGTVREQNGISVACDGQGAGCEARYARLHRVDSGANGGRIHTSLECPGIATWHRHVLAHPNGSVLVVDDVVATRPGRFSVQAQWNLLGQVGPLGPGPDASCASPRPGGPAGPPAPSRPGAAIQGVTARQGEVRLTLVQAGADAAWLSPVEGGGRRLGTRWNLRRCQELTAGQHLRLATRFEIGSAAPAHVAATVGAAAPDVAASGVAKPWDHRPRRHGARTPPPESLWRCPLDGTVTHLHPAGRHCLVGTDRGSLYRVSGTGDVEDHVAGDAPLSAVVVLEDGDVLTGAADGTLRRLAPRGAERWRHTIRWQPMNWDNWTRRNCAVLQLAAGDFAGNRRLVSGCADRHLYGFSPEGELLWRAPTHWGPVARLAVAPVGPEGQARVLVGMARPAIHAWCRIYDGQGAYLGALQRPDVVSWSIPSWMRTLDPVDLDGDGRLEVVVGMDTNHRQLVVYRADGPILWDADVGSSVTAVVPVPVGEPVADGLLVATHGGWLHRFDVAGRRLWARCVHLPVIAVAPVSARLLFACQDGSVGCLDPTGDGPDEIDTLDAATGQTWRAVCWPGRGLLVGGAEGVALWR